MHLNRELQGLFTNYYDLLRKTGEEIIRNGSISEETQAEFHKDFFPGCKKAFHSMADAHWTRRFNISKEKRGKIGKETSPEIDMSQFN